MAAEQPRRRCEGYGHSPRLPRRQARVTVKYNRKELQKRLDVETWIQDSLDQLYDGMEEHMPDEVDIDELLDLPNDEQRTKKLQEVLGGCINNTQAFISELLVKVQGVHKQEELQNKGVEHPGHHGYPHHHSNLKPHDDHFHQRSHQTL
ncbi:protein phosphatase 1, regulatory (inhibitor) subunit 14Aa [Chanos chanos]|uniref:Protein phosphatase 1, regulatory (Inhibitor) subunit 14Aa n=1 Tax=Chanos chanos TaxID=29144 RepID=A0A6J2VYD6_CHACN|nr:protein phosphatase 1 regulatory subunit 14A-like [Chanos chanos]